MTDHNIAHYEKLLKQYGNPIDRQIMLCDNADEIMILATVMMSKARDIFTSQVGNKNTAQLLRSMALTVDNQSDEH